MFCRCCKKKLVSIVEFKKPNVTSITKIINLNKTLLKCDNCGLIQSPSNFNLKKYYSEDYNLSLQSKNHDFFYKKINKKIIFKTDIQSKIIKKFIYSKKKIRILDFGCAKGDALKKLVKNNKNIIPYLFDLSRNYKKFWSFAPKKNQSIKKVPTEWKELFDIITNFFVLEHDDNPLKTLFTFRQLLKKNGKLILIVPDSEKNIGDHLLVDHINHFNKDTIQNILNISGFKNIHINRKLFSGSLVISCTKGKSKKKIIKSTHQLKMIELLKKYTKKISSFSRKKIDFEKYAIYGAGIYGTYIYTKLGKQIKFFIDQNPFLKNKKHYNAKIFNPDFFPKKISKIIVALNPLISKQISFLKINNNFKNKKFEYFL